MRNMRVGMNKEKLSSKEVLLRAASLIDKGGLAIEAGYKDGKWCVAAAIVESAYEVGRKKFDSNAYLTARNVFAGTVNVSSSYQGLVDWNDEFKTDKMGNRTYLRNKEQVVAALRQAAALASDPTKISSPKTK